MKTKYPPYHIIRIYVHGSIVLRREWLSVAEADILTDLLTLDKSVRVTSKA